MLLVIKYGGNAMGATGDEALLEELALLVGAGHEPVVVHGGGPEIDRALAERKVPTTRIDGLRVTDASTLVITEAVLCGTLNKRLVRACLQHGIPAVGISGEDGGLVRARRARARGGDDLGFVGEIVCVEPALLRVLSNGGFVPVVAPLAVALDATHAYNLNADTAAGAIAGALHADAFVVITNVARVLRDPSEPGSGIDTLSLEQARAFAESDVCRQSMRPKILAAVAAVTAGARASYVCAAGPGAIARALAGDATVVAA